MADGESSIEPERRLFERLNADHANLANLVLVIESLLERLHDGEAIDRSLLVDVVDYAADYLDREHEPRERRALAAVATVVPMVTALRRVLQSHADDVLAALARLRERDVHLLSVDDLVRAGFAYTCALRTRISFEESVVLSLGCLAAAGADGCVGQGDASSAGDSDRDRATFEALTARLGCGCPFE